MRKSIFGLLTNDFTDWEENEVGSVTEIVTDLTQLTPLANKLLDESLVDASAIHISMSLGCDIKHFCTITVVYETHEVDHHFSLKDITKELQ